MKYVRMPIEIESPEQMGYESLKCNLTESSFRDTRLGDLDLNLNDLILCYGDHLGLKPLREFLAHEAGVKADDVILTVGAASALFIVSTSLLSKGDRLLVVRPNYATNIETPRAIGALIDFYDLSFEGGYKIDVQKLISMIKPETKLVSVTNPHNPTGVVIPESELRLLADACKTRGCKLLVDETYRDMNFGKMPTNAANLGDHVISVCSLSKTYGLPGIRLGWLMNRDPKLVELFLAAKEQIFITGSLVDETIALKYLEKRSQYLPSIQAQIKEHFSIVKAFFEEETRMEWVETEGGVVCFPRIKKSAGIDIEKFYRVLNSKYGTFVGPGHWFEQDRSSMRIGFGWPTTAELIEGLRNISKALDESKA